MCYNRTISYLFAAFGVASILCLYTLQTKNALLLRGMGIQYILAFYTAMELLQGTQYIFINQCSNPWNIGLTNVAYLFVILQATIWNTFFYYNSTDKEKPIFLTAIVLTLVWMFFNIMARLLYKKFPSVLKSQTKEISVFASDKVCTKQQKTHLYWEWSSANFGELNANFLSYLMLWFIPALISKRFRVVSVILTVSALVAGIISIASGEYFVFTSLWCYISVPLVVLIVCFLTLL